MFCASRAAKGRLSCPMTGCGTGDAPSLAFICNANRAGHGRAAMAQNSPGPVLRTGAPQRERSGICGSRREIVAPECKTGFSPRARINFGGCISRYLHLPAPEVKLKIPIYRRAARDLHASGLTPQNLVPVRRIADLIADPGPSRNPHTRRPLAWPPRCVTNQRAQSRNDTT